MDINSKSYNVKVVTELDVFLLFLVLHTSNRFFFKTCYAQKVDVHELIRNYLWNRRSNKFWLQTFSSSFCSNKVNTKMVSRRKILNRSRDNLNVDGEEEDIWFSKDKLFKVGCAQAFTAVWSRTERTRQTRNYVFTRLMWLSASFYVGVAIALLTFYVSCKLHVTQCIEKIWFNEAMKA